MTTVITRYPPSPTGEIHIGNMRTMLFNYLWAKKNDGQVVLRFEDTDRERSDAKFEPIAIEAFDILGITPDLGPFRQSERTDMYRERLQDLMDKDLVYEGEESSDGSGNKVIRFRNPNKEITFHDHVLGEITIDTTDFGDFVIARSINDPIYHFTVVVDDIDMGITHILRGADHITSTPRQILLIEALEGAVPEYAHLPLINGDDKKKLSKRHGAVTVGGFVAQGYLPEAIVNYLAFLGWNPGDEREIFSLQELISEFSLERIGKSPATFNYDKLDDINRHYLMQLDADFVYQEILNFLPLDTRALFEADTVKASKIMELIILERIKKFGDVTAMADGGDFSYLFNRPDVDEDLIQFKDDGIDKAKEMLAQVVIKLSDLSTEQWNKDMIKDILWDWSAEVGRGSVLHPMRTTLSGSKQSPDPFTLAYILGKEETLQRLNFSK